MMTAETEKRHLQLIVHLLGSRGIEVTPDEAQIAVLRFADIEGLTTEQLKRCNKEFYDELRWPSDEFDLKKYLKREE